MAMASTRSWMEVPEPAVLTTSTPQTREAFLLAGQAFSSISNSWSAGLRSVTGWTSDVTAEGSEEIPTRMSIAWTRLRYQGLHRKADVQASGQFSGYCWMQSWIRLPSAAASSNRQLNLRASRFQDFNSFHSNAVEKLHRENELLRKLLNAWRVCSHGGASKVTVKRLFLSRCLIPANWRFKRCSEPRRSKPPCWHAKPGRPSGARS